MASMTLVNDGAYPVSSLCAGPLVAIPATVANYATPYCWKNIAYVGLFGGKSNRLKCRLASLFYLANAVCHYPRGWFCTQSGTKQGASCFHPKCPHILHVDLLWTKLRFLWFPFTMDGLDRTDSQCYSVFHLGNGTYFDCFVLWSCWAMLVLQGMEKELELTRGQTTDLVDSLIRSGIVQFVPCRTSVVVL